MVLKLCENPITWWNEVLHLIQVLKTAIFSNAVFIFEEKKSDGNVYKMHHDMNLIPFWIYFTGVCIPFNRFTDLFL